MFNKKIILAVIIITIVVGGIFIFSLIQKSQNPEIEDYTVTYIGNSSPIEEDDSEGVIATSETGEDPECLALGCPAMTQYAGSVYESEYYHCSCPNLKNIEKEYLLCFKTSEEAFLKVRTFSECEK